MADTGSVTFTASVLPEEYRKTFANETFTYTPADATEGWYVTITNVTTSNNDLMGAGAIESSAGTATAAAKATAATGDKVKFLFIKNTGTTNGSSSTTDSVYICFDGGTAAHSLVDAVEVPAGMSWFARLPNTTRENVHAIAGQANGAGTGGGNVQCIVAAILDDVSE